MRRRIVGWVNLTALVSFLAVIAAIGLVYSASFYAPPRADAQVVDYDAPPADVAATVAENTRASEYAYDVRVVESGGPWEREEPVTTVVQHTAIDNGARRLSARLRFPVLVEDGDGPAVRYFIASPVGQAFTPKSEATRGRPGWHTDRNLGFHPSRNAFDEVDRLRGATAAVVATNETTYVVRITNASAAVRVAYPGRPSLFGFAGLGGKTMPPIDGATANLTIVVDKRTDRPRRAVLRYWHPSPSDDEATGNVGDGTAEGGYRSRTVYRFSDYGSVDVDRPIGTYPPQPRTILYRLDLGVYAIRNVDYRRVATPVVGVLVVAVFLREVIESGWRGRP
jgi:hypothetical protein